MGNTMTAEHFGAQLRARRKALGITQEEVAMNAGVGRRAYVELEAGKGGTSLSTALQCARLLGLDITLTPRGQ